MTDIRAAAVRFMDELARDNWPSDEAWNALRQACGLPPLSRMPAGGGRVGVLEASVGPASDFDPAEIGCREPGAAGED